MSKSLYLSIAAFLNVVTSFFSQIIVYSLLGVGSETDALVASATIPHMLAAIFTIALSSALVPIFSGEDKTQQNLDFWSVFSYLFTGFTLLALILIPTAQYWVPISLPGFEGETLLMCIRLVKIQLLCMVFIVGSSIITALIYARNKFLYVELITLSLNVLGILAIYYLVPIYNVDAAAWVNTLRPTITFFILVISAGFPIGLFVMRKNTREVFKRIKPVLMGNSYTKTERIIEKFLLSTASPGAISLLSLAQQIYSAASNVVSKTFGITAIPKLSIFSKENDRSGFKELYNKRIILLFLLTAAPFLVLTVAGEFFLSLLFDYGRITTEDIAILKDYMVYLGPGFIAATIGVITTGAFYAVGNTHIPNRILVIYYTIFIVLKVLIYFKYGIIGLCIVSSIYHVVRVITERLVIKSYYPEENKTDVKSV